MSDALIHLRVPAATKARWVRESRAAGMRLADWIVSRVEAQPMAKNSLRRTTLGGANWARDKLDAEQEPEKK